MTRPHDFTAQALLKTASERCRLNNFGDDHFRPALEKFIQSCAEDGYVSDAGYAAISETLIGILVNRLRVEDDLIKHPEILDEELVSPLIIIGAGRVGSTKMHRLLANASAIQSFPLWQLKNPAPPPGVEKGKTDPRIVASEAFCKQVELGLPQLFAAIEPIAMAPDEDAHLLDYTFMQFYFSALAYAPGYLSWIFEQDWREPYRYVKKLLQYLQWQNGTVGKPLLLKGPFHTAYMDILSDLLPGARFVQIHRDPVTCAASLGKVAWMLQNLPQGTASLEHYGHLLEDYITNQFIDNLAIREKRPDIKVADFYYEEVINDAVGLARKMFDFWGQPLAASDIQAMQDWEHTNGQHKFGKFEYTIEEMGVDRARMEARLEPYMQRFYPTKS